MSEGETANLRLSPLIQTDEGRQRSRIHIFDIQSKPAYQNYRLNPPNLAAELPRERELALSLSFLF